MLSFSSRIFPMYCVLGLSSALLTLSAPSANAQQIVSPNNLTTVEGGSSNRFPFFVNGGIRYQQVYNASQFSGIGAGNLITQIAFRLDGSSGSSKVFTRTLSNVTFRLSTTAASADGLSTTFASNLGADATIVRSGPITISSANTVSVNGTKNFDVIIPLTTSFLYNPALGNLLFDMTNSSPENTNSNDLALDAGSVVGDGVSRIFGGEGSPNATTGSADTLGLVTRFTFVNSNAPEPGTLTLLALGMVGGIVARRRK